MQGASHQIGSMFSPRNHNGNMPAVQGLRLRFHGVIRFHPQMRTTIGTEVLMIVMTISKLVILVSIPQTRGDFLICMEMSGNGLRTFTKRLIQAETQCLTPPDQHRVLLGSIVLVHGWTMGQPCVRPFGMLPMRAIAVPTWASVSPSGKPTTIPPT